jgi:hypothetical protein
MARRNWTRKEEEYVLSHYGYRTSQQMADHLGRSPKSVRNRCLELFPPDQRVNNYIRVRNLSLKLQNELLRLHSLGHNDTEIARLTAPLFEEGWNPSHVARWRRYFGLEGNRVSDGFREGRKRIIRETCARHGVKNFIHLRLQRQRVGSLYRGCLISLSSPQERVARAIQGKPPQSIKEIALAAGYDYTGRYGRNTYLRKHLIDLVKLGVLTCELRSRAKYYSVVPGTFTDDPAFNDKRSTRQADYATYTDEQLLEATH